MNSTYENTVNIRDIRKLISAPVKSKAISNKKETAFNEEITMNGKNYRECIQNAMCYIKKSSRSSLHSLVCRGANNGVAGSDRIVIETHPHCKDDIRIINNYDVNTIYLVTTGEVTSSITGEVVFIMNQHAFYCKNKTIHS